MVTQIGDAFILGGNGSLEDNINDNRSDLLNKESDSKFLRDVDGKNVIDYSIDATLANGLIPTVFSNDDRVLYHVGNHVNALKVYGNNIGDTLGAVFQAHPKNKSILLCAGDALLNCETVATVLRLQEKNPDAYAIVPMVAGERQVTSGYRDDFNHKLYFVIDKKGVIRSMGWPSLGVVNFNHTRQKLIQDLANISYPQRSKGLSQGWNNLKLAGNILWTLGKNPKDLPACASFISHVVPYMKHVNRRNNYLAEHPETAGFEPELVVGSLHDFERITAGILKMYSPDLVAYELVADLFAGVDMDQERDIDWARKYFS